MVIVYCKNLKQQEEKELIEFGEKLTQLFRFDEYEAEGPIKFSNLSDIRNDGYGGWSLECIHVAILVYNENSLSSEEKSILEELSNKPGFLVFDKESAKKYLEKNKGKKVHHVIHVKQDIQNKYSKAGPGHWVRRNG